MHSGHCIRQKPIFPKLIKLFKNIWENQVVKLFLWTVEAKHHSQQVQMQWTCTKCQRYRVDWWSNQLLFNHYQHAKVIQSAQLIRSFVRYT